MRKLIFIICFFIIALNLFSANRFWNKDKQYDKNYFLSVESIISYNPSIVKYAYGSKSFFELLAFSYDLLINNDVGVYFSDSIQWQHTFNFYPCFQTGVIFYYRWFWGTETFAFANMYRWLGFNFDIYNLSIQFSFFDCGFIVYKYGWFNADLENSARINCLLSPITSGINYRIRIANNIDAMIHFSYSMQIIIPNNIMFPKKSYLEVVEFGEHVFNMGLGFRFYYKQR